MSSLYTGEKVWVHTVAVAVLLTGCFAAGAAASASPGSVEEAVNLMQGRYVYRRAEAGSDDKDHWIRLERSCTLPGIRCLETAPVNFNVGDYLTETGLGASLGLEEWTRIVNDLEKGYRCNLKMWTGKGFRMVKVEADPERRRVKVINERGWT